MATELATSILRGHGGDTMVYSVFFLMLRNSGFGHRPSHSSFTALVQDFTLFSSVNLYVLCFSIHSEVQPPRLPTNSTLWHQRAHLDYQEHATRSCSGLKNKQVNNKNNVMWGNVTEYDHKSSQAAFFE